MERVQNSNNNHVVLTIEQAAASTKTKQSSQAGSISDPIPQTQVTKTLRRLNFSKPRSRFEEVTHPLPPRTILESKEYQPINCHEQNYSSTEEEDDEEWYEEEEEGTQDKYKNRRRMIRRKINKRAWIEFALFLIIMTCLIASLTLKSLEHKEKCGLQMWKWCLMVMVVFCGRLVSSWVVSFLVFLIERNFMLREKVLYFVFGLSKSFRNCAWLALVLIAWMILFPGVHKHNKILKRVFRALIAVLVGATIWLLKIVFVKVLASSFHVATYFDRMKESVFHHYILDALSGPPLDEDERELPNHRLQVSKSLPPRLRDKSGPLSRSKQYGSRRIDPEKLKKLSMTSRATAWSVKRLVNYVRSSGLSSISRTLDDFGKAEITSEWEARNTAQRIFKHVAKPGAK